MIRLRTLDHAVVLARIGERARGDEDPENDEGRAHHLNDDNARPFGQIAYWTTIGRLKVENKFELKKMTRNKKLELD